MTFFAGICSLFIIYFDNTIPISRRRKRMVTHTVILCTQLRTYVLLFPLTSTRCFGSLFYDGKCLLCLIPTNKNLNDCIVAFTHTK